MNPASINTGTFVVAGVAGTVTYDSVNKIGAFKPFLDFAPNATYNASITAGATDLNGTPLAAPFNFSFTTRASEDTSPPVVVIVNVAAGATCVPLDTEIQVTLFQITLVVFSTAMWPTRPKYNKWKISKCFT